MIWIILDIRKRSLIFIIIQPELIFFFINICFIPFFQLFFLFFLPITFHAIDIIDTLISRSSGIGI